jgi:hypothetical protein
MNAALNLLDNTLTDWLRVIPELNGSLVLLVIIAAVATAVVAATSKLKHSYCVTH